MILKARYVVPVCRPPLEHGAVEIGEARIVAVRRAGRYEVGTSVVDCGDAVLLPGLVNAHTHLELTHLAGQVPPSGEGGVADRSAHHQERGLSPDSRFVDWLRRLHGALKAAGDDPELIGASANRGAALSLRAGVTTVGDITRRPAFTRAALRHGRLRVVSFGEVLALGTPRDRLKERLEAAHDVTHNSDRLEAAVSPHSPYTCDRRSILRCKAAAARLNMRLCMHLAETEAESACTLEGRGPLVEWLRAAGVWDESVEHPGLRPVDYVDELGVLSPRTLLAHVNYAGDGDLERIARSGAHVAYCPRTHAAFGHPPHRFRDMRGRGINVCIGTDSLASNPSLSILEELRYLHGRFEGVAPGDLVEMGTRCGARALGWGDKVGSLEPGRQADLIVVPLEGAGAKDPLENVLSSGLPPTQVYVAGQRVDGAGEAGYSSPPMS